jgi:thiopeptide-type bacteriocin biosynthesis protein
MQMKWLSAHIFYSAGLNRILRNAVIPFLHTAEEYLQLPAPYFFIRYGEGGPHVRLRLCIQQQHETSVKRLLADAAPVQYIPYEQEIKRYGNERSILLAEQHFYLSSAYILRLIGSQPEWNTQMALAHALQMNMTLLYAMQLPAEQIMSICSKFIRSWLPRLYDKERSSIQQEKHFLSLLEKRFAAYAPVLLPPAAALWSSLQSGQTPTALQQYAPQQLALMRQYQATVPDTEKMSQIVCSLLHMQHNRLGIANQDEAYIVYFTMKCMSYVYEQAY